MRPVKLVEETINVLIHGEGIGVVAAQLIHAVEGAGRDDQMIFSKADEHQPVDVALDDLPQQMQMDAAVLPPHSGVGLWVALDIPRQPFAPGVDEIQVDGIDFFDMALVA